MKLNLGCGNLKFDGYLNIDISPTVRPDMVFDISTGLPFEDGSIDEIVANGVLEQFEANKTFVFILNECHRVLKNKAILKGQVPSTDLRVLCLDPYDRRWFLPGTFNYFNYDRHEWRTFGKQYGFLPWCGVEAEINDNGIINFTMLAHKE